MRLNRLEFALMNNPLRAALQRRYEGPRLLRMGGALAGGRALEIGCGRGVGAGVILDLFGAARVDAFDFDPSMVDRARARLAGRGDCVGLWVGDAAAIAAPDETYDAVFDFGIVHHIGPWRSALAEVHRVLKPGGRFYAEEVLRDLIENRLVARLFEHPRHDRFDAASFAAGLREAGLTPLHTEPLGRSFAWFVAVKRAA